MYDEHNRVSAAGCDVSGVPSVHHSTHLTWRAVVWRDRGGPTPECTVKTSAGRSGCGIGGAARPAAGDGPRPTTGTAPRPEARPGP